jgi:hypothetical protein
MVSIIGEDGEDSPTGILIGGIDDLCDREEASHLWSDCIEMEITELLLTSLL